MENKALEHSLDLALDDPSKNAVYAGQNGYGYHGNPHNNGQHPNGGECKYIYLFIFFGLFISLQIILLFKLIKATNVQLYRVKKRLKKK